MLNLNYVKMKKMRFLLVLLVGISIVSCTNDLDEMLGTQNLQTRSVEPRFTGNISESQAIALMNKFLDAPSFFYFEDVIGFDPTTSISTGSFTVNRNGKTIHVRSIQVGVIGKNGKYGVYGTPVTSKEFYSLRNGMVLHGEPIYEENDVERITVHTTTIHKRIFPCNSTGNLQYKESYQPKRW